MIRKSKNILSVLLIVVTSLFYSCGTTKTNSNHRRHPKKCDCPKWTQGIPANDKSCYDKSRV